MPHTLPYRRLWSDLALSQVDLRELLETAAALKQAGRRNSGWRPLLGRHVALLCADAGRAAEPLRRAIGDLGGTLALLNSREWRSNAADRIADAARLLGRLYDAVDCCDLPRDVLEHVDRHAGVPVFDGLARADHPMRLLADLSTMSEVSGKPLQQLRLCIDGDPQTSLHRAAIELASLAGIELTHAQVTTLPAMAGADDVPLDTADFVLDTSAPPSTRLVVPNAPAVEQARVAALLADNHRHALQSLIVSVLG
jgi:ornithine carbamoyltransferase